MSELMLNVSVTPTRRNSKPTKNASSSAFVTKSPQPAAQSKQKAKVISVAKPTNAVIKRKSASGTFIVKPIKSVAQNSKPKLLSTNTFVSTNKTDITKSNKNQPSVTKNLNARKISSLENSNGINQGKKAVSKSQEDHRDNTDNSTKDNNHSYNDISGQKNESTVTSVSQGDGKVTKGYTSSLFRANPPLPVVEHKEIVPITESVFSSEHVDDMPIHDYSKSNLKQNMGIDKVTTVQQLSLPVLMSGQDALIRSQTGSGKTLAYAIPIVESLHSIRPKVMRCGGVMALVIVPTRELALQTYECFVKLVKPFTWVVPGYLVGGEKRKAEKARLRKGITILVGTPGRLLDHVNHTKSLLLDRVRWLILDEADLLLDMGYERDVGKLVEALDSQQRGEPITSQHQRFHPMDTDAPEAPAPIMASTGTGERVHRQTVLLSATLTAAVERLAGLTLRNPKLVDAAIVSGGESTTTSKKKSTTMDEIGVLSDLELVEKDLVMPESLKQSYMLTPAKLRLVALAAFIVWKCRNSSERKMLIFMATQDMVDYHTELFSSILATRHAASSAAADDADSDLEDEYGLLANKDDVEDKDGAGGTLVDIDCVKLHGNMSQKERTDVFKNFRTAASGVLLCTDVAARGLDLPQVDWIVQYTAPATARDYVHRVGRAARAGSAGNSLIILAPTEADFVKQLEERRVCIRALTVERTLKELVRPMARERPALLRRKTGAMEEAATMLQARFEDAVETRRELHDLACKAYVSWVRFYSSYPLESRKTFDFRSLHLGHYAKSFAIRDPPTAIAGVGKRQWLDRQRQRKGAPGPGERRGRVPRGTRVTEDGKRLRRGGDGPESRGARWQSGGRNQGKPDLIRSAQKRERDLVTSEFGSGMPAKRSRQN